MPEKTLFELFGDAQNDAKYEDASEGLRERLDLAEKWMQIYARVAGYDERNLQNFARSNGEEIVLPKYGADRTLLLEAVAIGEQQWFEMSEEERKPYGETGEPDYDSVESGQVPITPALV